MENPPESSARSVDVSPSAGGKGEEEQVSPSGTVRLALASELKVAWSGSGPGDLWIGGRPVDLRAAARRGDVVQARFRIEQPPAGSVRLGVRCSPTSQAAENGCGMGGGAMLDATQALTSARRGAWATLSIPLVCFADRAAGLSSVAAPFGLRTEGSSRSVSPTFVSMPQSSDAGWRSSNMPALIFWRPRAYL